MESYLGHLQRCNILRFSLYHILDSHAQGLLSRWHQGLHRWKAALGIQRILHFLPTFLLKILRADIPILRELRFWFRSLDLYLIHTFHADPRY